MSPDLASLPEAVGPINVTARELARATRECLDRVEEGHTLVVIRGSRAVARIEPLEDAVHFRALHPRHPPASPGTTAGQGPEGEADLIDLPEDPLARRVLLAYADGRPRLDPTQGIEGDVGEVSVAASRLEVRGFIRKRFVTFRITAQGLAAAARLQALEGAGDGNEASTTDRGTVPDEASTTDRGTEPGGIA